MKRKEQTPKLAFKRCILYRDDIQSVIDLMTIDGKLPAIESGSIVFESAEDLYGWLGKRGAHALKIECASPTVTFGPTWNAEVVEASSYQTSDSAISLVHKVADILRPLDRGTAWRSSNWLIALGFGLAIAASVVGIADKNLAWLAASVLLVAIFFIFIHLTYNPKKQVRFYGINKRDKDSFWIRKRDDLAVAGISAVLGAIFGIAGTLLAQHLANVK